MRRFKGHSMVILNCGIPTIMLELTLISFCNIVNQITLHLKKSRTRDLQLVFCILNLYTMHQLAFSPGSRNEGMYVCYVCVSNSSSAFPPFRDGWESLSFIRFPVILALFRFFFSTFLSQKVRYCSEHFLLLSPPLWKSCPPFCAECDLLRTQHGLWACRDASVCRGEPYLVNIIHFLCCVYSEISLWCEVEAWWICR